MSLLNECFNERIVLIKGLPLISKLLGSQVLHLHLQLLYLSIFLEFQLIHGQGLSLEVE